MLAHILLFVIMIIRLSVQGRQVEGLFAAQLQQDEDESYRFFLWVCVGNYLWKLPSLLIVEWSFIVNISLYIYIHALSCRNNGLMQVISMHFFSRRRKTGWWFQFSFLKKTRTMTRPDYDSDSAAKDFTM